jgi:hypothetical protein
MSPDNANGANPLRWDCQLPGRRACGAVEGIAEINGNLLVLEWKEHRNIPTGQRVLYTRWTANGPATVMLIVGDARHMTVDEAACIYKGAIGPWRRTDIAGLRQDIRAWAEWALAHPVTMPGDAMLVVEPGRKKVSE